MKYIALIGFLASCAGLTACLIGGHIVLGVVNGVFMYLNGRNYIRYSEEE